MNSNPLLVACLLILTPSPLLAQRSDMNQPIRILTEQASIDQKANATLLKGNIEIRQGSLLIYATRIKITGKPDKNQVIEALGSPVRFQQILDFNKRSPVLMKAYANVMNYDSQSGNVLMQGNAFLKVGRDQVQGHTIHYNTHSEHYTVLAGKDKKRISMILYPKN